MPTHKKIHSCKPLQATLKPKLAREYFFLPHKKKFCQRFFKKRNLFFPTHGFTANTTSSASNVNRFVDSVCGLDIATLRTDRRATDNTGPAAMAVLFTVEACFSTFSFF